jgi:preprotein translocase subunit SecD
MQKKMIGNVALIVAVLVICVGWIFYRYSTQVEVRTENYVEKGKTKQRTVEKKKVPINLGLDLQGGVRILLEAIPPKNEQLTDEKVRGLIEVMRNRLDPEGVKEILIQKQGSRWVNIEIPGERDPEKVERLLIKVAKLEFIDSEGEQWEDGYKVPSDATVVLTGSSLKKSAAIFDSYGRPAVSFEFKKEAADKFGKFTARNVNKYLAIAVDGIVISCPQIHTAIFGGSGQITGRFTIDEVRELVTMLNSGALPLQVTVAEKRAVGPSLGAASIRQSLIAGFIGIALVLIFMIAYYRLPGLLADVALLLYIGITLGIMSMFNVTLTLPGMCGFVLSVGMAVDANVIIFERLREEIRWGKTLKAAIDAGFTRAFTAILDSNVTTLIATVVLYAMGTGTVRGFAVTLSIGIIVSMYSAIFVTRIFLMLVSGVKGFQSFAWYGAQPQNIDAAAPARQR